MTTLEIDWVTYEEIWAPWRLAYIKGEDEEPETDRSKLKWLDGADQDCFLCQAVADAADRQRHVVYRGDLSIVVLNKYPYNNGHLLVAPKRHKPRLDQLTAEEHCELVENITRMVGVLDKTINPEGFNVGLNLGRVAGAGLPQHLHWHVVPRWNGDTNFMPTLASVNVIPQSLDALWKVIVAELSSG